MTQFAWIETLAARCVVGSAAVALCMVVGCASDFDSASDGAASSGGHGDDGGGDSGAAPPPDPGPEPDPDPDRPDQTTGEPACDDAEPVTLFLSPDDSNSMSSPIQAREAILGGWSSLSAVAIRPWEFLNYYHFPYPPAEPGSVSLFPAMRIDPEAPQGEYRMQIGISSPAMAAESRPAVNVTFVLDSSGSMSGPPMDMLKESCRAIAGSLREGDIVSMVTWDTQNAVVLGGHRVTGPNDPALIGAITEIQAGGGTDLHGGLVAGYELAAQVYQPGLVNRIVLVSDGGANVGVTDIELIAEHAGSNDEDGIYMVGVGVGSAESYHDDLMDQVTDAGKGASVFVASADEAHKLFGLEFLNTMAVSVRDVRVRLDLPAGFEIIRFSGEEFSSNPDEIEPQHLAPNDAMVFHQQIRTCAPELVTDDTEITITAQFKDALTFEEHTVTQTVTFGVLLGTTDPLLDKGAAVFAYAEALAAVRDPDMGSTAAVETAKAALQRAREQLGDDPDLAEIQQVLEQL